MPAIDRDQHKIVDPAPSRWSYKLLRLMLTPFLRRLVFFGGPTFVFVCVVGINLANLDRREQIKNVYKDLQLSFIERPEFEVNLLSIRGASPSVAQDIRDVLQINFPVSQFHLNLDQLRSEILDLGPVKDAVLRRRSSGVLEVNITEKIPAVIWRHPNGLAVLDKSGSYVRTVSARRDHGELLLIAGEGADRLVAEAINLYRIAMPIQDRIRGFVLVGQRRWDIVLDRNQRILLPTKEPGTSLERIMALHQGEDLLARDVNVVDFRIENRPTLRLEDKALKEMRKIDVSN